MKHQNPPLAQPDFVLRDINADLARLKEILPEADWEALNRDVFDEFTAQTLQSPEIIQARIKLKRISAITALASVMCLGLVAVCLVVAAMSLGISYGTTIGVVMLLLLSAIAVQLFDRIVRSRAPAWTNMRQSSLDRYDQMISLVKQTLMAGTAVLAAAAVANYKLGINLLVLAPAAAFGVILIVLNIAFTKITDLPRRVAILVVCSLLAYEFVSVTATSMKNGVDSAKVGVTESSASVIAQRSDGPKEFRGK
jgi:hypothetical protein